MIMGHDGAEPDQQCSGEYGNYASIIFLKVAKVRSIFIGFL
jgi:hypothetical protein